jgi:predicted lipoprotein with Yx(FWY)xxD motif
MKTNRVLPTLVAAGALALAGSAVAQSAHLSSATIVTTKKSSFGTILVTSSGRTLYLDAADKAGHPACTHTCLSIWPPLKASGTVKAGGGARASLLGTTKIAGAIKQVTYGGHPLYTFASDTRSGQISGEGQNGFYVVSPSGNRITKKTATTTTGTTTTSTTYGY